MFENFVPLPLGNPVMYDPYGTLPNSSSESDEFIEFIDFSMGLAVNDSCGRPHNTQFVYTSDTSIWLTRISFPIFLLIGTVGNSAGIWLVARERHNGKRRGSRPLDMSRTRKIFLLALFVSDLCYLWNRLIFLLATDTWTSPDDEDRMALTPFMMWTHGVWAFLDAVISFSSQGVLVAFCIDRYYALTSPLRHKTNPTLSRTTSLIVVVWIYTGNTICSLIIPVFYYWKLTSSISELHSSAPADTTKNLLPDTLFQWRIVDAWGEVIIRVGSAAVIIILNRLIFLKLRECSHQLALHTDQPGLLTAHPYFPPTPHGSEPAASPRWPHPDDPERHSMLSFNPLPIPPRPSTRFSPSRSANIILLCSSVFYLATNALDLVLSVISMLGMYPLCGTTRATEIIYACEPFRDFLRHSYFALSFMFYVCLKLRNRPGSSRRRRSSSYLASNDPRSDDMRHGSYHGNGHAHGNGHGNGYGNGIGVTGIT